jgi:hypothetical protein
MRGEIFLKFPAPTKRLYRCDVTLQFMVFRIQCSHLQAYLTGTYLWISTDGGRVSHGCYFVHPAAWWYAEYRWTSSAFVIFTIYYPQPCNCKGILYSLVTCAGQFFYVQSSCISGHVRNAALAVNSRKYDITDISF